MKSIFSERKLQCVKTAKSIPFYIRSDLPVYIHPII